MDIIGNKQWVCIPNEKRVYDEPIFLDIGEMLTTNFDKVKTNLKLSEVSFSKLSEKDIYNELSKEGYKLTEAMAAKVLKGKTK